MDSLSLFLPFRDCGTGVLINTALMTLTERIQYHYKKLLKLVIRDTPELFNLMNIIKDKLAELVNQTHNGPSAFNNYITAKHS